MDCRRIEILYLIDYFHRTRGTEKHLAQLIAGLPADALGCSLVAFDMGSNPLLDGLRAQGVPVVHLPVGREYVPHSLERMCAEHARLYSSLCTPEHVARSTMP